MKTTNEKYMEKKMENYVKKALKITAAIVFGILLFALAIYVLMRLWNWLAPDLFGWQTINYWQALGLFVLAKILFGFGGEGSKCRPKKYKKKKKWKAKCDMRKDFSDWKFYDDYWKDEGEASYKAYVARKKTNHYEQD
ncbi:hypothetical protein [Croceivirga radicis]|uniref:Uncharacterized protein n=1 Tax=Croceivirga radicis TaxID=1929488 RepID=A0A1V6LV92_9FLAO|nr:hypothetical protein [Croceivirga radicis]OQD44059.1 hypothetical protein BUL40_00445 [Croceivirga radicis]